MRTKIIPQELITRILSPAFKARFWEKVEVGQPSECWNWQRTIYGSGYGIVNIGWLMGRRNYTSSHRVAWVLSSGKAVPEGKWVLHTCVGNKRCCNPDHLYLGTHLDNMRDMAEQGRLKGERNAGSRLKAEDVIKIRSLHSEGVSHEQIASAFGITEKYVWVVALRHSWTHI